MCVLVFLFLLIHFRFPPSKYLLGMCICHIRNTRYDKVELFFFFFKGGLICRHYIEGLYYTALLLFFFFVLLLPLSRVTLLSLFVCMCVFPLVLVCLFVTYADSRVSAQSDLQMATS